MKKYREIGLMEAGILNCLASVPYDFGKTILIKTKWNHQEPPSRNYAKKLLNIMRKLLILFLIITVSW
jgi:hypothetical protein